VLLLPSRENEYQAWVSAASIACFGVRTFELKGNLKPDVCVSHGSMKDARQQEIPTLTADEAPVSSMSITLISGTEISLSLKSAKLSTVTPVKRLERWIGPLA